MNELPILFHDPDLVAVNKPSGLLVHRTKLDKNEKLAALQMVRDQVGERVFPVHRLDRPTSGVLLFAKSSEVARRMAAEFAERRVQKTYMAVVRGAPQEEVTIDYPLREELDNIADSQACRDKAAQPAVTRVWRLATIEFPVRVDRFPTSRYSLVRAQPETGRKHQIRRHLRHIGHPVIGDITHGVGKHNRFFENELGIRRLLLACTEMTFTHPTSQETVTIKAPLCSDYLTLLKKLGWLN